MGKKTQRKAPNRKSFFHDWALDRARTLTVDGIYVLITKSPGYVQVEVGNKTAIRDFTETERDRLGEMLQRDFGEKKFDTGLIDGVKYVQQTMDAQMPATGIRRGVGQTPAPAAPGNHKAASTEELGLGGKLMGMICIGLVAVLAIWVVIGLFRHLSGSVGGGGGQGMAGGYGGGGYGGGGGGGFLSGLMGGMLGGAAGSWMYDRFFRDHNSMGGGGFGSSGGGMAIQGATFLTPLMLPTRITLVPAVTSVTPAVAMAETPAVAETSAAVVILAVAETPAAVVILAVAEISKGPRFTSCYPSFPCGCLDA